VTARPAPAPLSGAARRARRLGVLGGTFDPPHLGHLHAARRANEAFALEHVVFVPAARPPHKPERVLADAGARLEMLALLLEREPGVSVWDVELARRGPSYTVETLRELRELVPEPALLFLILGEDNLEGLPGWRAVEEVVALAQPIVVHRSAAELGAELAARLDRAAASLSVFARTRLALGRLACPALDASSTRIRAELARGSAPAGLPPGLLEYVRARGLYR
jgi:nicotinate-nucleotide adenylyltransferase